MTVLVAEWEAQVLVQPVTTPAVYLPLELVDGTVKLDKGWSPYGQAEIDITLPNDLTEQMLDATSSPIPRVQLTGRMTTQDGTVLTSRVFDLQVRESSIDRVEATMHLGLYTDEATLMDYLWTGYTVNTEAEAYQHSLRELIDNVVLSKIGAELEPGDTDASYIALDDRVNLILNPSAETNVAEWAGGSISLTRWTRLKPPVGVACIRAAITVAGTTSFAWFACNTTSFISITGGERYSFSFMVTNPYAITRRSRGRLRWLTAANATISETFGAWVSVPLGKWTRITVSGVAPASAERIGPILEFGFLSGTIPVKGYCYVDAAILVQGAMVPYFDGSTPDTPDYAYSWEGAAHASRSLRTALFSRPVELLHWEPGISGSDFLDPLLITSSLRLFCDEQRRWWLVDTTYEVPGLVALLTGINVVQGSELASRNEQEGWADAVVAKYTWKDSGTLEIKTKYDIAKLTGWTKAKLIEYETPYPGQGSAQYLLQRAQELGLEMEVLAVTDFDAVPSAFTTIQLPETDTQTGFISSVEWGIDSNEMTVSSHDVVSSGDAQVLFRNDFETGLAPGTILDFDNSDGTAGDPLTIEGVELTASAVTPWQGDLAGRMTLDSDSPTSLALGSDAITQPVFTWRTYIRIGTAFPADTDFMQARDAFEVPVLSIRADSAQKLSLVNAVGSAAAFSPATALAANTWYRVEGYVDPIAQHANVRVFVGASATVFTSIVRNGTDYGDRRAGWLWIGIPA